MKFLIVNLENLSKIHKNLKACTSFMKKSIILKVQYLSKILRQKSTLRRLEKLSFFIESLVIRVDLF